MPRYDDRDLFRKLDKERPLVKQMERGAIPAKKAEIPERQRPVEILNTRPAEPQRPAEGAKPKFRETGMSAQPKAPRGQELNADLAERRNAPQPRRETAAAPQKRPESRPMPRPASQDYAPSMGSKYDMNPETQKKQREYRHELKYYLNMRDYEMLRAVISSLLVPDENSVEGGYHIRSLYFDDVMNSAVREKLDGVLQRKKYRIRMYNLDDSFLRLERKLKNGEYVSKDNLVLTRDEVEGILDGDYAFLLYKPSQLAHDFYYELQANGLRPATIVDYYREAFTHPVEDVRITFDTDLRSGVFSKDMFDEDLQTMPMFEGGTMVLEVKYNQYLPKHIKLILNNAEYSSRSAVSKYVICRTYE